MERRHLDGSERASVQIKLNLCSSFYTAHAACAVKMTAFRRTNIFRQIKKGETTMFKKYLSLILTVLVINLSLGATAFAGTNAEKTAKFAEKVKTNIARLGTGKDARVEVKLRDKTKLKGYISRASENSFTVIDEKTGNASEVFYANAKQVKGNNLSEGVKIALGIGLIVGLVAFLIYAGTQ